MEPVFLNLSLVQFDEYDFERPRIISIFYNFYFHNFYSVEKKYRGKFVSIAMKRENGTALKIERK